MAVKVSDRISTFRYFLSWAEDLINIKYTQQVSDLRGEVKLAQAFCSWAEFNFVLEESFMEKLNNSLYEKENKIYHYLEVAYVDNDFLLQIDNAKLLFSAFIDFADSLQSLFLKTLEEYSNQQCSKQNISMEELLNLISLVSEDSSIEIIRYRLQFMKGFIRFADLRWVSEYEMRDLLAHGEFMLITAALYSYMHRKPGVVVDIATTRVIENQFSEILLHQSPLKVREILEVIRSSLFSSSRSRIDDLGIVVSFMDSLVENHMELLESSSSFIVSVIKIIVEEFRFLKNVLMYKKSSEGGASGGDDDHLVRRTIDLVIEVAILMYSHYWDVLKLREEDLIIRDVELGFFNWTENVELFKRDVGMKYPEETAKYKFPRTNELGFIDGLLDELKQLMIMDTQVLEDLVFLRDFLGKIVRLRHKNGDLNALWIQVVEVSYRIDFVVNSMLVGDSSPDCTPDSFNSIKEQVKKVKEKVKEIYTEKKFQEMDRFNLKREKVSNNLPSSSSSTSNPTMKEVFVGLEDEVKKIIDRIEAKSSKLDIVSIVGMAGLGKTTIAKKVYNEVKSRFQVCSWCCISQGYQKQKWLLDILRGTLGGRISDGDGYDTRNEGDLEKDLYQSLKGNRYLIVLDDTWEIESWRGLKTCFPDDNNGSRILLTTRIHDVALYVGGGSSDRLHFIRSLNDQESWKLMQTKLFPNQEYCSKELQSVAKRVAESCKGLPFAIVTVAGILGTVEQDKWDDFAKRLINRCNLVNQTDVLELSYVHLPDYLKPCLLYLGSFLQDQKISVSRLIWLWIAEGLVMLKKNGKQESLENLAMEYLKDLIKRSLVMVEDEKSRGGIKCCSIHDLVHQFCTTKAKEENFQQQLNLPDEIKVPLPEPHRLCIYSAREYFSQVRLSFRHLSSLILLPAERSVGSYYISSNFKHFKLLNVLDLRGFICGDFPSEIEMLVQLRYLALVGEIKYVPSTIAKLSKLETFLLKGTRGEIGLPFNLLNNLKELRHLHVNNRVVFDLTEKDYLCPQEVCNLETFCTLLLSNQEQIKYIILKIRFIQKLKCTFLGSSWGYGGIGQHGYQIPSLNILSELESLKLHSIGKVKYKLEFNFPSNLRKLTLSNFYLPWERISVFAELPNLEVLKLLSKACEGEMWDMGEEQVFSNLQFLKLENLDIVNWNAYSDNFPRLRKLVLNRCKKLHGIPVEMGEIDTLKVIEVKWCKESVATSAQALEEAIEGLKVFVHIKRSEGS